LAASTARRYAQAIFNILDTPETLERVEKDLAAFWRIVEALPGLARIVSHPAVPVPRREKLLDAACAGLDLHPISRGAIGLLVAERGLKQIPALIEALSRLRDEKLNVASAFVTTALPLADGERPAWESAMKNAAGKPVRIEFKTDSSLIGGAVARIGSVLYDGSVRGSLEKIRRSLLGD
jgi:F-type H+-transporting ATPase subunit delta